MILTVVGTGNLTTYICSWKRRKSVSITWYDVDERIFISEKWLWIFKLRLISFCYLSRSSDSTEVARIWRSCFPVRLHLNLLNRFRLNLVVLEVYTKFIK
jgi:hypothetical protein